MDFGFVRVAAVVPRVKVADVNANVAEICRLAEDAERQEVSIAVFPELSVTGYTCADLFGQQLLIGKAEEGIKQLKSFSRGKKLTMVVGVPVRVDGNLYNCAAVIHNGKLSGLTIEERRHLFPGGERQAGNVESVPMAAARMFRAFDDMLEVCPERVILGVTHGGIINAVFSRLTSGEIGTGKTLTVNCSASLVAAGIGSPIPLAYNIQEDGIVSYLRKMAVSGADF